MGPMLHGLTTDIHPRHADSRGTMTREFIMSDIIWPEGFVPGFTDNFCSNEVIVEGVSAADIWPLLVMPSRWPTYYSNAADVKIYEDAGPALDAGVRFFFTTFGFPIEGRCLECVPPIPGQPARIAWHGWSGEEGASDRMDVHHAWLIEDLSANRVRILTQETQNGEPAKDLARQVPNPMINGHQEWLDGLVATASAATQR